MPSQPIVIKFFAPVIDVTINALMNAVDQKMKQGQHTFVLLISSPGGSVFHGLSAYNYLKGLPADITTHNLAVLTLSESFFIVAVESAYPSSSPISLTWS